MGYTSPAFPVPGANVYIFLPTDLALTLRRRCSSAGPADALGIEAERPFEGWVLLIELR